MGFCISQNHMWSAFADDVTRTVEVCVAVYMAFCKNVRSFCVTQFCQVNKNLKTDFGKHRSVFPTGSRDEHSHLVFEKLKVTYFSPRPSSAFDRHICIVLVSHRDLLRYSDGMYRL